MRRTASGRSTHPRSAATDQAANAKPTTAMLHGEFSREVSATRPLRGSLLSGKYSNAARARLSSNFPSGQPAIAVMADPRRPERAAEPPTGVVGTLVVPRTDLADLRSTVSMSRRRPWMACSNGVDLLAPVSVARYEGCYRPRRHRIPASELKRTVDSLPKLDHAHGSIGAIAEARSWYTLRQWWPRASCGATRTGNGTLQMSILPAL